jgi:hypothetical protein
MVALKSDFYQSLPSGLARQWTVLIPSIIRQFVSNQGSPTDPELPPMSPQHDSPLAQIPGYLGQSTKMGQSIRRKPNWRRRRVPTFRPSLDRLETRQMLATSTGIGQTAPMETLNLQFQPGSNTTLTQLMPLITAAGATVQSTTISGLIRSGGT